MKIKRQASITKVHRNKGGKKETEIKKTSKTDFEFNLNWLADHVKIILIQLLVFGLISLFPNANFTYQEAVDFLSFWLGL
ncbi:hypothetical protein [Bacillus rhizoplanae]|uniref:hypothetical protein n=1 Tax=Bacillus rhizoplanae TaxID=2880966 RepID=UPI003D1E40C6